MAKQFKNPYEAVGFYVVVIIFIVFTLFPLLWVMRLSIDDADAMAKNPGTVVPKKVILDDPKDRRTIRGCRSRTRPFSWTPTSRRGSPTAW
jgi:ABC-type glycerol-3-phosphate transport system permease component